MSDEVLDGIVTVAEGPIDQTAEEALASIRFAAINQGVEMAPEDVAAALRKFLNEHDADLVEMLAELLPNRVTEKGLRAIPLVSLKAWAKKKRAGRAD